MKKLHEDLVELTELITTKNLRTEIFDKFGENIEMIVRGQLMNSFTLLKTLFISKFLSFFTTQIH